MVLLLLFNSSETNILLSTHIIYYCNLIAPSNEFHWSSLATLMKIGLDNDDAESGERGRRSTRIEKKDEETICSLIVYCKFFMLVMQAYWIHTTHTSIPCLSRHYPPFNVGPHSSHSVTKHPSFQITDRPEVSKTSVTPLPYLTVVLCFSPSLLPYCQVLPHTSA